MPGSVDGKVFPRHIAGSVPPTAAFKLERGGPGAGGKHMEGEMSPDAHLEACEGCKRPESW